MVAALIVITAGLTFLSTVDTDFTVAKGRGAALRGIDTSCSHCPAGPAETIKAFLRTAVGVCRACLSFGKTGTNLDASGRLWIADEPFAAISVHRAAIWVGALRHCRRPTGQKCAESAPETASEQLEHTAARGPGADQPGEVVEALPVHPPPLFTFPYAEVIIRILYPWLRKTILVSRPMAERL